MRVSIWMVVTLLTKHLLDIPLANEIFKAGYVDKLEIAFQMETYALIT